jgi:hypothetical protein
MNPELEKGHAIPENLRLLLDTFRENMEEKLQHKRRVMIIDLINHISCLDRQEQPELKDAYARLLVILNIGLRAGKFYYDEL